MAEEKITVNPDISHDDLVNSLMDDIDDNLIVKENAEKPAEEIKEPKVNEEVKAEEESDDDYLADVDTDEEADGDTPEEESETEEDDSSDDVDSSEVTLKVDGEEITVTMDELKKGYSRQSDYTKKTQELAEQRKALEEEAKTLDYLKVQAEFQPKVFELQELESQIRDAEKALHYGRTESGDELTKEELDKTKDNVDNAKRRLAYETEELQKKMKDTVPPKLDELQKEIPDLFSKDDSVRQPVLDKIGGVLKDFGYTEVEIQSINDPRRILELNEIVKLRELAARVEKAKARRSEKKGVVSKSTKSTPSRSQKSISKSNKTETSDNYAKNLDAIKSGDLSNVGEFLEDLI